MREDGNIQPAKITHITQQGYQIKGIIHGGANDGEEVYSYQDLGIKNILCFEPLKSAIKKFRAEHPDVDCIEMALGAKNTKSVLKVTAGDGKGSSLLDPNLDHPEVKQHWTDNAVITKTQKIGVIRLDTFFAKNQTHKIEDYDCLVLDTQGNELDILIGCGELLQNFKYISVELSQIPVYAGEIPGQEVIDWLVSEGFTQDTPLQSHNDVMFIRNDIKPSSGLNYYGLA